LKNYFRRWHIFPPEHHIGLKMFGSPSVPIFDCLKMYIPWTTAGSSRPKSLATCRVFSLNVTYPTKNFTKLSIIFLCKRKCLHCKYLFLIELSFVFKKQHWFYRKRKNQWWIRIWIMQSSNPEMTNSNWHFDHTSKDHQHF
jgi:hypothetical protein